MEVSNGFGQGFNGMAQAASRSQKHDHVAAWCNELGWKVDESDGQVTTLYFDGDRASPRRDINIIYGPGDPVMTLSCFTRIVLSPDRVPPGLAASLLKRNREIWLSRWEASVDKSNRVHFSVGCTCFTRITAKEFAFVCTRLLAEVAEIETALHAEGLLPGR